MQNTYTHTHLKWKHGNLVAPENLCKFQRLSCILQCTMCPTFMITTPEVHTPLLSLVAINTLFIVRDFGSGKYSNAYMYVYVYVYFIRICIYIYIFFFSDVVVVFCCCCSYCCCCCCCCCCLAFMNLTIFLHPLSLDTTDTRRNFGIHKEMQNHMNTEEITLEPTPLLKRIYTTHR